MRPKRYYLGGNAGTEAPSNLVFFDSESWRPGPTNKPNVKELRLRLWSAIALRLEGDRITRRVHAQGRTEEEFWTFLDSRCHPRLPLWAFAHNLGFDLTLLDYWHQQRQGRYTIGPVERPPNPRTGRPRKPWVGKLCLEARPTFLVCRGPSGTLKMVCTGNYWPGSVEDMGQSFGLAKVPLPDWDAPEDAWFARCDRDVEILEAAVVDLIKRWVGDDSGTFQLTAPALAMRNFMHTAPFRAKGRDTPNLVIEPEHPAIPMERDSLYGGRFEAFKVGQLPGPVYHLDVNSCYLSAMEDGLFPVCHRGPLLDPTPDGLWRAMQAYGAVARVLINATGDTYPIRLEKPPAVLHATGRFWTTLTGAELLRALDSGHVDAVEKAWLFSLGPLFKGWARKWHDRKIEAEKNNDRAGRDYAKLIGLSLYGKWSQHGFGWHDRPELGPDPFDRRWAVHDVDEGTIRTYRAVAGVVQEWCEHTPPRHLFPAISAYVSAMVRERMRTTIAGCPERSVYYLGADSLIVSQEGYDSLVARGLVDPQALGLFKVKGAYSSAEVRGANVYRLGDHWTQAGSFGRPKVQLNGKKTCTRFENLPGILARVPDGTVRVEELDWSIGDPAPKGTIGPGGWVSPLWLTNDPTFTDLNPRPAAAEGRRKGYPS